MQTPHRANTKEPGQKVRVPLIEGKAFITVLILYHYLTKLETRCLKNHMKLLIKKSPWLIISILRFRSAFLEQEPLPQRLRPGHREISLALLH